MTFIKMKRISMRIEYFLTCSSKVCKFRSKALQLFWKTWRKRVRNHISNEHRHMIVRAIEEEMEDYLLVVDTLGINRSTARGIIATYVREGRNGARPRGDRNNVKVDDDMKDCPNNILKCMFTLDQINQELRSRCPTKPHVHQRTIAKA